MPPSMRSSIHGSSRRDAKCAAIIAELSRDLESEGGGIILILADHISKEEFELRCSQRLERMRLKAPSQVIFRPGNPCIASDLIAVSLESARAIVSPRALIATRAARLLTPSARRLCSASRTKTQIV